MRFRFAMVSHYLFGSGNICRTAPIEFTLLKWRVAVTSERYCRKFLVFRQREAKRIYCAPREFSRLRNYYSPRALLDESQIIGLRRMRYAMRRKSYR